MSNETLSRVSSSQVFYEKVKNQKGRKSKIILKDQKKNLKNHSEVGLEVAISKRSE